KDFRATLWIRFHIHNTLYSTCQNVLCAIATDAGGAIESRSLHAPAQSECIADCQHLRMDDPAVLAHVHHSRLDERPDRLPVSCCSDQAIYDLRVIPYVG